MRELIKKQLLFNLLSEVTKRYDYIMIQNAKIFDEITHKAMHDELTDLYNRYYFIDQLKRAIASSRRHGIYGAVLFIDLDNFKIINDTAGHKAGDTLLQLIAKKLFEVLREEDIIARFGGDEFVILIENLGKEQKKAVETLKIIADKLLESINYGHIVNRKIYHITASIGIALFNNNSITVSDILRYADSAMYEAKKKGKSQIIFFNPKIEEKLQKRVLMETSIRQGIEGKEFFLVFQPQVDFTGKIIGAEALVRWNNREQGIIPPAQFIPFAEETKMIIKIGEWLLQEACKTLIRWQKNPTTKGLKLSINCSLIEFMEPDFDTKVIETVKQHNVDPSLLTLEITESLLVQNNSAVKKAIRTLREFGISIALDDFGTGYSSLSYLKNFPINILKIDRVFIRDIFLDHSDQALVRAIFSVAQDFGIDVVVEGVEKAEQEMTLRAIGGEHFLVQGFLYGKPMGFEQFEHILEDC